MTQTRPRRRPLTYQEKLALQERKQRRREKMEESRELAKGPIDLTFCLLVMLLTAIGLVILLSASFPFAYYKENPSRHNPLYYFERQAVFAVLGTAVMLLVSKFNYQRLRGAGRALIYVSVLFLILVIIPHNPIAVTAKGATRWLKIGVQFQPSEIAKICYIFAGSATLERLFRRRNLALFIVLTGVCIGLLGLMSDFGTAAIFFVTFLVIAYLRSGDWATLALICGGAAFGAGIIVQFKPYILSRFAAWGHAWEAASSSGYQQTRTMSAAASGGLFGMGAGNGCLERIPAGDTDLVFGMLCEEWGLVIALLAVACILTLAWFAVRASRTGRSSFYTIAACAAGSLLVFQTCLNVFGAVDILPLTGVTLPFVSNGGSAMLSAWGLLAYLKAMDTRADASFAIGRAAERKLDEEAARMAAPAEDAFEKEDGHAED